MARGKRKILPPVRPRQLRRRDALFAAEGIEQVGPAVILEDGRDRAAVAPVP